MKTTILVFKPFWLWMIFDGVIKHQTLDFNLSVFSVWLYLVGSLLFFVASVADDSFDKMYLPAYITKFCLITDLIAAFIFAGAGHFFYATLLMVAMLACSLPFTDKKQEAQ